MKRLFGLPAALALSASAASAAPGEGFDVRHYAVALTPMHSDRSLVGRTQIELQVTAAELRELAFTPNGLQIASATLDGRPIRAVQREDALAFLPSRPLRRGARVRLEVAYSGTSVRGLTFGPRSVHSNWFACDWMICLLDRPGDKATIDLRLTVPSGHTTLGPGVLLSRGPAPGGNEVHRWHSTRPYSSFLFSFAAGSYNEWSQRDGRFVLRALSETASPERLGRLFAPTARMLRFFERRAGVPFPHRSYTQLHVPGAAAQETVSFSLIGEEVIRPIEEAPAEDWAIAHELAHQYWGNLITCADWSHFWLNEGVVTFLVAAWKEERWGRAAYDREMEIARRRWQRAVEAGLDVPLTYAGTYPSPALRRAITYSKGALFLDALRTEIGDEAFWRGLRRYTIRHAGGTVVSRDFQRAYEEASGRDLTVIFERWVYGPAPR
ncbi:MAG TPA: M1 family metallopeptidase [Allosphingosinicella sp.]|jgi:aminopeptidase N